MVKDRDGTQAEIVSGLDYSTFQPDKQLNTTWQITFTAYKLADSLLAFNLLQNKSLVQWHGQWFSVEQLTMDAASDVPSKQITATHVWFGCSRIRASVPVKSSSGTSTDVVTNYTVTQLMHYAFDNNKFGYTWELKGADTQAPIQSFSPCSALDVLNNYVIGQINWVVTADNYHIIVQSLDSFRHETGTVINYYDNSDNTNIQWDTTAIVNQAQVLDSNNKWLGTYTDKDSVNQYGVCEGDPFTADTTDVNTAWTEAQKQVSSTAIPQSTMTSTYKGNVDDYDLGDMITLKVKPLDISQELMCTEISATPYTGDPETITWTTGTTNKAGVNSLLQLQNQLNLRINELKSLSGQKVTGIETIDGGESVVQYKPSGSSSGVANS
ncbi:prophage endopeptidase tail family protein [Loigolactobacillus backii]|uniref:prophage endopeptidase tail family protein n=1 Tax=Loigolactobacillus backii TaxID=375175 RepID=UPI0007F06D2C|nr:prophage endopeptidase tail family protein [Loigolactobacillus backii]ANK59808.1 hypothetical protein AYR52_05765 [Loigolactobacillus backii]